MQIGLRKFVSKAIKDVEKHFLQRTIGNSLALEHVELFVFLPRLNELQVTYTLEIPLALVLNFRELDTQGGFVFSQGGPSALQQKNI